MNAMKGSDWDRVNEQRGALPGYGATARHPSQMPRAVSEYNARPHDPSCAQWKNLKAPCNCSHSQFPGDGGWDADVAGVGGYATAQAHDICERLLPEWRALFLEKNRKYRRVTNDLGPRGVFPDINRKHGILRDRVWDGSDVVGEPTREVILDQIGHLFLMLHMMDDEGRGE